MSTGEHNPVTPRDVESLIEIFQESGWDELHVRVGDFELFLSNDPHARGPGAVPSPEPPAVVPPSAVPAAAPAASNVAPDAAIPDGMVAIRAPNLGTFYRAPKPGAPPYVDVGQRIAADTEVCLIEVMKLFAPVRAGIEGTVREVRAVDGTMVEFDQILFVVEPDAG